MNKANKNTHINPKKTDLSSMEIWIESKSRKKIHEKKLIKDVYLVQRQRQIYNIQRNLESKVNRWLAVI